MGEEECFVCGWVGGGGGCGGDYCSGGHGNCC